jgi:hypothetical protein
VQGDSRDVVVTVLDVDAVTPLDLTGAEVDFTVFHDDVDIHIFQKRNATAGGSDAEINMAGQVTGVAIVHIIPADTTNVPVTHVVRSGRYTYRFQVRWPPLRAYTLVRGVFTLTDP